MIDRKMSQNPKGQPKRKSLIITQANILSRETTHSSIINYNNPQWRMAFDMTNS